MKIWFDILTPKQVMFFAPAVSILRKKGHKILCTSRDYREAVGLAKLKGFGMEIVGSYGGAARKEKLEASAARTSELARIAGDFSPDVAVTFSSPEGARVAFGLGIKHVGFNDSPHAESVARLTIPLMNRLLCPWIIPHKAWTKFGIARKDITRYRALDPAVWIKHMPTIRVRRDRKKVVIRLAESKASYIADKALSSLSLVDLAVVEFSRVAEVSILCRYQDQIEEARRRYSGKAEVMEDVFDGASLLRDTSLFVGAGGTMTAEAALFGVPTISIAPVRFLVEDYLVRTGLAARTRDPRTLVRIGKKMLFDEKLAQMQRKNAAERLSWMEDPTEKIIEAVLKG